MENPFEKFGGGVGAKEIPPAEETEEREPDIEAVNKDTEEDPEKEKTKELLELTSAAKGEAKSIIDSAFGIRNQRPLKPEDRKANWDEGKRVELKAYRIYAALDMIGAELSPSIIKTTNNLLEGDDIDKFYNKKEAENFLRRVVKNTEDEVEDTKQVMVA